MMLSRRPYLWNPCIRTLYVDTRHVPSRLTSSLALSPDGRHLVSAHIGALRIWDVTAGTCLLTLHRRNVVFDKVMFSADGSLIVSTSHDNIIRFWKSDIGEEIAQLAHQNLPCIALTTDKKCLASGGSGMPVRLWYPESIEKVFEFGPASKNAQSLQFYSQNELVSLHENGTVHMWHFDSSDPTQSLNHFEVTALALSPKGDCFVGTKDGDIYRWSMKTSGKATRAHRFGSEIRDLVVIGVDDCIAAAVEDGRTILLGDNWNGAKLVPLAGHEEDVHSISFSPATNILASAADDLTIRIWYWHHGAQMVYPTTVDPCCIIHFVLSPDNSLIAVIRDDGELKLFTVEGQFHTSFDYHYFARKTSCMVFDFNALELSVKFSPNGLLFAFQSRNGSISICNVVERRKQTALPHQDEELRSIAFSSDNARLVSGSAKDVVRVWNINTAQCIAMWRTGEYGNLRSVGFSADGSSIGVKWSKSASICKTYWDANSYAQLQNSTLEEIVPIDSGRFFLEGGWINPARRITKKAAVYVGYPKIIGHNELHHTRQRFVIMALLLLWEHAKIEF
ncbi:hypothetical protein FRC03_001953 [Tulasnella sp. 419]|nr:hypothetical protein FRC03_001953 [Tulasnella sp. 419]